MRFSVTENKALSRSCAFSRRGLFRCAAFCFETKKHAAAFLKAKKGRKKVFRMCQPEGVRLKSYFSPFSRRKILKEKTGEGLDCWLSSGVVPRILFKNSKKRSTAVPTGSNRFGIFDAFEIQPVGRSGRAAFLSVAGFKGFDDARFVPMSFADQL